MNSAKKCRMNSAGLLGSKVMPELVPGFFLHFFHILAIKTHTICLGRFCGTFTKVRKIELPFLSKF
jgi:hypothetical protein